MPANARALIFVLVIAWVIFWLGRSVALRFCSEADFERRRRLWYALTVAGFLSPSFWLFAIVAIPLLVWGGRKDTNPIAFYLLMLHVVPMVDIPIPVVGIESLFSLNIYRLLCFCVLIPTIRKLRLSGEKGQNRGFKTTDVLLLSYGLLQTILAISIDSPTSSLRRTFLFFIDTYFVYYAVSRFCSTKRSILEAQAAFCLSCGLMAAFGAFESIRHWLLYSDFSSRWGINDFLSGFYIMRGDSLRSVASSGNTLALGYLLSVAFGFWLYLRRHVHSVRDNAAVIALFWIGMLSTYSRGPWMGAVVIYFGFAMLGPGAFRRVLNSTGVAAVVAACVLISPLGDRIAKVIPFMGGSVDSGSIQYRQQLADLSWDLFRQNPLFGDQNVLAKMEALRQGVGLIDLVNTYAGEALFDGLVGLLLFVSFILVAIYKAYRRLAECRLSDPDYSLLGGSIIACIVGTMLMIATCSLILGYQKMYYVLGGMAVAYASVAEAPDSA